MTDAHCHVARGAGRHFLCEPCDFSGSNSGDVRFVGFHPWHLDGFDVVELRRRLVADPRLGVGEIGLDRLRAKEIPPRMREAFEAQLALAAELGRPVALHGAKCWGEVVETICRVAPKGIPALLFHGFSRSAGLLPEIVAMNGYVSVGPAILNDHAVNYRELAKTLPADRLLVETDCVPESAAATPEVEAVATKIAEVRGERMESLATRLEENADRFIAAVKGHLVHGTDF